MTQNDSFATEPFFLPSNSKIGPSESLNDAIQAPRILVIGVGDLGCYIAASLLKQQFEGLSGLMASRKPSLLSVIDYAETLLVNTDTEIPFDEDGRYCAKNHIEKADLVLLIGALGGSSGAPLLALAEHCNLLNVPVVGVVVLPFTFEGKPKNAKAKEALAKLNAICNGMLVLPNDRLKLSLAQNTSAFDALNAANLFISELLTDLLLVLGQTGLINLDFNDFLTFIRDARNLAPFRASFDSETVDCSNLIASLFKASIHTEIHPAAITGALVHFTVPADFSLGLMHEFLDTLHKNCPAIMQVLNGVTVANIDHIQVLLITSAGEVISNRN